MSGHRRRVMWVAWLAALLGAGCAESMSQDACGDGTAVTNAGGNFCVYRAAIVIVGGFDCPASRPYRMDFESAIVCSDHGFEGIDVPHDICARAFVPCDPRTTVDEDSGPQNPDGGNGTRRDASVLVEVDAAIDCDGMRCQFPHADAVCVRGQCLMGACHPGFGTCNGDLADGCELALDSASACGSCGNDCGTGCCVDGVCSDACGDTDCTDGACELLHTIATCNANGECVAQECEPGWVDCDGAGRGCAQRCLSCPEKCSCPTSPYEEVCDGVDNDCDLLVDEVGTCTVDAGPSPWPSLCPDGFADCDADPANGCETSLKTNFNCGACGVVCTGDCSAGACVTDA